VSGAIDAEGGSVQSASKLHIAVEAPPWYEIPPHGYGGIEWICYWLVNGLVDRGHDVTLIGAGGNHTNASFFQTYERPPSERLGESVPEVLHAAACARALDGISVDVIHTHMLAGPLLAAGRAAPTIATAHGPMAGELGQYYRWASPHIDMVAISRSQRAEAQDLPWAGMVYNGIPVAEYPYREHKEDYVLFLGRMCPEKGVHLAIDAARKAGVTIVVAAKCTELAEQEYFAAEVGPRLGRGVEWIGPVGGDEKKDLLARARCLVNPIQWREPFGIVMVEALACGTPVVATRFGSVPEVVAHGVTGWIVDHPAALPEAIHRTRQLSPVDCRRRAESMFDTGRMVEGYERIYWMVLEERLSQMALAPLLPPPSLESVESIGSMGPVSSTGSRFPERRDGALSGGFVGS
jgi:glycosyltransferase involved in cell wall biosynthesis